MTVECSGLVRNIKRTRLRLLHFYYQFRFQLPPGAARIGLVSNTNITSTQGYARTVCLSFQLTDKLYLNDLCLKRSSE